MNNSGKFWNLMAWSAIALTLFIAARAEASTYAVFIPLDDPIYYELDTLDGLGLLDSYLSEIKPISRVEAARLVIEAENNAAQTEGPGRRSRRRRSMRCAHNWRSRSDGSKTTTRTACLRWSGQSSGWRFNMFIRQESGASSMSKTPGR